ncbi:hypothetical protein GFH30_05400 [Acinetobacter wanghuae]|uniref:DUF1871 family protein n=1 Tax=Acinetobacter wanghuae TaxID=2662362 RepID=A0A5Q0P122_9GAMM|nr:hypothetical protein [Acinetobacter wanghuae]MQW91499.1 hypothetical protein [Acinetobacter wanghuae]QGA10857.1 hypothetical protein GFH30_05400 [Acinetobacter wanghuae]
MSEDPRADQFIEDIRQALIQVWDPKGIAKNAKLHDEYDDYLDIILDNFEDAASEERLAELLLAIEQAEFNKQRGEQAAKKAAEKIWQAFEKFIA